MENLKVGSGCLSGELTVKSLTEEGWEGILIILEE